MKRTRIIDSLFCARMIKFKTILNQKNKYIEMFFSKIKLQVNPFAHQANICVSSFKTYSSIFDICALFAHSTPVPIGMGKHRIQ